MNATDRLLTNREVADMLGVHPNTVKRMANAGELPFIRIVKRGDRRYRLGDVQKLLEARWKERE